MIKTITSNYIDDVIGVIKNEHGDIAIEILDEEEIQVSKIYEELSMIDIFGNTRFFILRNPKEILKYIKDIDTEHHVYIHSQKKIKDIDNIEI
jgi:DNA polymerase III delta subunit